MKTHNYVLTLKGIVSNLYDTYAPACYGLILRMVQDEELANTILFEVFSHLTDSYEKINNKSPRIFTYLIEYSRKLSLQKIQELSIEFSNPESTVILMKGISRTIFELSYPYNEVLYLSYFRGFTDAQIASVLKLRDEEVRPLIQMAVAELRKSLANQDKNSFK